MCPGPWTVNMSDTKMKSSPQRQGPANVQMINNTPATESNTFLSDITGILFILKLTGLLPIYTTIKRYQLGPSTNLHRLYSAMAQTLVHAITIFNIYCLFSNNSIRPFYSMRETDNINHWIETLLCVVTYTTTVIVCAKNAKSFLKLLNDTLKVDEEITRHFSAKVENNCEFAIKMIILIIALQWYIVVLKVLIYEEHRTLMAYILISVYSIQNGLSSVFIVYASIMLRLVSVRFAYFNLIINGYTYKEQQGKLRYRLRGRNANSQTATEARPMENFPDDALLTFRMYNKLLRLYKSINDSCSLILVVYMGYAFYSITTTTYNLFVQITTQREVSPYVLQICFALLFNHTAMLAILSRCSGQATDQANITAQILARVYGKNKEYKNIVDKFLTKSIKQEVQFTAYGFFVIDNSTLFKIFSAVTTYLVILIQFRQLEESRAVDPLTSATTDVTTTIQTN